MKVKAKGLLEEEMVKSVELLQGEGVMIQVKFARAWEGESLYVRPGRHVQSAALDVQLVETVSKKVVIV